MNRNREHQWYQMVWQGTYIFGCLVQIRLIFLYWHDELKFDDILVLHPGWWYKIYFIRANGAYRIITTCDMEPKRFGDTIKFSIRDTMNITKLSIFWLCSWQDFAAKTMLLPQGPPNFLSIHCWVRSILVTLYYWIYMVIIAASFSRLVLPSLCWQITLIPGSCILHLIYKNNPNISSLSRLNIPSSPV